MAEPGTNNTDAPPYPVWGFAPPSPEPDTKTLDALLASLNASAERFQTLWFSFLGLTLYLAIAALATTHRDLLLNNPQTLPILNIKVELLPFYIIAPLLYLVFHFYLLMMLALLARTAAEFDKQLRTTLPGRPEQERYRAQVGNALFLQLLVGMKGERTGINALLMGLIALITIVLAPLATLVLMQMMFLPYHHLRITWWHRAVVVTDLVVIIVMTYRCFFPRGARKAPLVLGALSRKPRWATAMVFVVLLAAGLFPSVRWLSFQQGQWAGEPSPSSLGEWTSWMRGKPPSLPAINPDYAATKNGVVFGWFPDRLKLGYEMIVGRDLLEKTNKDVASGAWIYTIDLSNRDLQAAQLVATNLRGARMDAALIQGADFSVAGLEDVRASCEMHNDSPACAQLQGATLSRARLRGADFSFANMRGADLDGADLQGAYFVRTQLQGANLEGAQLQASDLASAKLQGANLAGARLLGSDLQYAQLQGANLEGAKLRGANLTKAQLQGADLSSADLADSELNETFVFRVKIADANTNMAEVRSVHADEVKNNERLGSPPEPLKTDDVDAWIVAATQSAPKSVKTSIIDQFSRLKPNFNTTQQDGIDQTAWVILEDSDRNRDPIGVQRRRRLAELLGSLACAAETAPYVARTLVGQPDYREPGRLAALGDELGAVRERLRAGRKEANKCPGVVGFNDNDWRALDALKPSEAAAARQ
jgi:uncharacterized protein YjbI with pentapeptide repeats